MDHQSSQAAIAETRAFGQQARRPAWMDGKNAWMQAPDLPGNRDIRDRPRQPYGFHFHRHSYRPAPRAVLRGWTAAEPQCQKHLHRIQRSKDRLRFPKPAAHRQADAAQTSWSNRVHLYRAPEHGGTIRRYNPLSWLRRRHIPYRPTPRQPDSSSARRPRFSGLA
ncbi:hypothetical protein D3C81_1785920 [compost metagenome]